MTREDAVATILGVVGDLLPPEVASAMDAARWIRREGELPVVAVAGGTGSGKSSLVNVLAGAPVTEAGVLRPTTNEVVAVLPHGRPAPAILDRLGVLRRPVGHQVGVVLCDLPDLDSLVTDHRQVARSILDHADGVIWVVDPEKYADAVIQGCVADYDDLPGPIVCAHADRLTGAERLVVSGELRRLAPGREVLMVSMPPGGLPLGVAEVADRVASIRPRPIDHATRGAVLALREALGAVPDPTPGRAWSECLDAVDDHVGGVVADTSRRLVSEGRRRALTGSVPVPPSPAGDDVDLSPPGAWPSTPVTMAATEGWASAAGALADAVDGVGAMAGTTIVPPVGGWALARRLALAGVLLAVAAAIGVAEIPPWSGVAVAAFVLVVVAAGLTRSGGRAGLSAADRLGERALALLDASRSSPVVSAQTRRCADLDRALDARATLVGLVGEDRDDA